MKRIYERFTRRTLLAIVIVHFSMLSFAATYYVSNTGNDSNSGLTAALAWKTLARVNAATFTSGDQILFNKGDSFYGTLMVKSSGTSSNPIIFGAYGTGTNPIITGFTTITGWTNEGSGIYSKVITSDAQTNMVTIDGENTAMGRTPNAGTYNTYESYSTTVSITDTGLGTSTNWNGAEVVIRKNAWTWDRGLINNHTGDVITYSNLTLNRTPTNNYGYFFQNDLRTLDQLGEWFHNTSNGKFYMYFGAIDPTTKTVKVATKDYGIYNYNATNSYDYITCDNINIVGFIKSGVYLATGSTYNIIQNCLINFCGRNGVEILGNANHITVNANTISNTTNGAIYCSGTSSYLTATNNTILNTGLIIGSNLGLSGHYTAISTSSTNDLIQYNSITNTGYDGIFIAGNSTDVRNNIFDNSCLILNDGGGIYIYGTHTSVVIDGNIVLNSYGYKIGTPMATQEGYGIYLDEYANGITVSNNTAANCTNAGIIVHKGHDDTITGNTLYNNFRGIMIQNWINEANLANLTFTGNVSVAKSSTQFPLVFVSEYTGYATSLSSFTMSSNYYARPIDDNASINTYIIGTSTNRTLAQWKTFSGKDTNSNKSPQTITSESDLQFEYNANSNAKTVSLSRAMIDIKGNKYATAIILQPYTSAILMKDLTPAVVPGAPTSVVAAAGNASASITFMAPISNGGSAITGYTVTSIPAGGIDTNAGTTLLTHTITGLTNGTSYTFTVKATNSVGTSVASVASNSVIPAAPVATTFTFAGPSSGNVNSASTNFTVAPNNLFTGTITLTPSGAGSAGLNAKVLTFLNSSAPQTFTITPTVAGSITLTPSNSGTLINPANLLYTSNAIVPDAPTAVIATSGDASASVSFVAPMNNGGSTITGYTVTSIPAGGIDANAGSTELTHTITGLTNGTSYTFTVKATNSVGSSITSVASNSVIPVAESVITKQGVITPTHFTTVWQGLNGLNQMNINVVAATLEDIPLSADDEIAVFSGSACVGASKLTKSIIPSDNTTFVTILASQNDGSGNGFIDNDTIVFKIWNNKTQSELQINSVIYHSDISTWKTNGKYSPASTAVAEIASYQVYTQSIPLLKGYNMISTYLTAQNPNLSAVTKTLVDQGNLIKMQDETGNSYENWGNFGGWINKLGSLEETEGYKIQVANNCTLQVTGRFIAMPFDIALKTGWNIISFPRTDVVNALNVVQALIDQNKLVKVQDEAGNSIENWGLFGGWKNGIGNFIPGKAYKVKMSADAILTFQESYPKSAVVIAKSEQTEYYHSSVEGNGTDHMNINITDLKSIGLSAGDELAAFDGAVCVATTKITEANLLNGSACLVSSISTDNQNPNGFKSGNPIQIMTWNKLSGDESKVNAEVITGQLKYEKNASVLIRMKSATIATAVINLNDAVKIDVFPNPCQGKVTVRFSEIPEANSRIEISDISGRKLISRLVSGTSEEFNLDSFTPGLYLVRSILGKSEFVQKLIVNK